MSDNGILASIPGQYVAAAIQLLPPPESSKEELVEVQCDVPGVGRVRFEVKRMKHTRHKSTHYFWTASKATLV